MKIVKLMPSSNGAYSQILENVSYIPDGWAQVSNACDTSVMQTYCGFVTLITENNIVTAMIANNEAYDAWNAAHPVTPEVPQPTLESLATQVEATQSVLDALLMGNIAI